MVDTDIGTTAYNNDAGPLLGNGVLDFRVHETPLL